MMKCPETIDGALVILSVELNRSRHRYSGTTRLYAEAEQKWFHRLVIARYGRDSNQGDVYLFYCNEPWETENDSCYSTIEEAAFEAARQFEVVKEDWQPVAWPFDQTRNTGCISTRQVFDHKHPVLFAQHFEDDHSWVFGCGTTNAPKDCMIVTMSEVLAHDPSIVFVSDLPPGASAERADCSSPWIHRSTSTVP